MGKYLSVLSEVSEKQLPHFHARAEKKVRIPTFTNTQNPHNPDKAAFWRDVSTAIQDARRGNHLAFTDELRKAWKAVNELEGRVLNSRELCAVVRSKNQTENPT